MQPIPETQLEPVFHARGLTKTYTMGEVTVQALRGVDLDLYGETARLQFVERLRGEQKFSGIDELSRQLKHDVDHARRILLG